MSRTNLAAACTAQTTVKMPLGAVLLARTPAGLAGVWFEGQKDHPGRLPAPENAQDPLLECTAMQLAEYFSCQRTQFDLPLDLVGSEFQCSVWKALLEIGRGNTTSYGEIARKLKRPKAARAVGAAIGRNPVSVIVPCHRVVGSNGTLTGYAGGLHRKSALLKLEGVA